MFAERKWNQFPSWSMSSLCVKSPATDFGGVRAISSFQSSPEQPSNSACSKYQTKYFRTDICRKIQSSNKSIWEKSRISECCWPTSEVTASAFSAIPRSGDCPGLILLTHIPRIEEQNSQYQCGERTTTEFSLHKMDVMVLPRGKIVTSIQCLFRGSLARCRPGEDNFFKW